MIELLFACAAALFVYSFFRMAVRVWQFTRYEQSFGGTPNFSLDELATLADDRGRDLPAFTVIVPAWDERETIQATMRRIATANYPRTHIDLVVVTYADEPPDPAGETTADLARRTVDEINTAAGRSLARVETTPVGFDGFFPGAFDTGERHIGKARGLNFALRRLHERIEADERRYALGRFVGAGQGSRVDAALDEIAAAADDPARARDLARQYFVAGQARFVGPAAYSWQVLRARDLAATLGPGPGDALAAYAERLEPRFYLSRAGASCAAERQDAFLAPVAHAIEAQATDELGAYARTRAAILKRERPRLASLLAATDDPEEVWALSRRMNSRWVAVFDADADAPPDLFRHLAARILTEDTAMAFQGPVAPVANFDEIHPLCGLAGLWLAFGHATVFPRLMTRPDWARPLAGTNWCVRTEGMEHEGRLLRTVKHDEARRRFLLHFDPRQLTEDLEAGLRFYSDWRIAAEWHPCLEWEQAPPRPADLVGQWTRWTLGTLQVGVTMLASNLPVRQRIGLAMLPLDVAATGLGPALTVVLWTTLLAGGYRIDPALTPLTVFLTCVNLFYAAPFMISLKRFRELRRAALVGDALLGSESQLASGATSPLPDSLREGLVKAGVKDADDALRLARAYLRSRCVDPARADRPPRVEAYLAATPEALREERLAHLLQALAIAVRRSPPGGAGSPPSRARDMWKPLAWAIPFLLFQLYPFYRGLAQWLSGNAPVWRKTARTPKS